MSLVGIFLKGLRIIGLAKKINRQVIRHDRILNLIEKFNIPRNAKILDLGCGDGRLLKKLSTLGFTNLYGCDIICLISTNKFKYFMIDLNSCCDLPETEFDFIISSEVIEHLHNVSNCIKIMHTALKDNAMALITYPNCQTVFTRLKFLFEGKMLRYTPKRERSNYGHLNIIPSNVFGYIIEPYFTVKNRYGSEVIWHRHKITFLPANSPLFYFDNIYLLKKND